MRMSKLWQNVYIIFCWMNYTFNICIIIIIIIIIVVVIVIVVDSIIIIIIINLMILLNQKLNLPAGGGTCLNLIRSNGWFIQDQE